MIPESKLYVGSSTDGGVADSLANFAGRSHAARSFAADEGCDFSVRFTGGDEIV